MNFPDYADILIDQKGFITYISLNRPHRKNALRPETISELIDAFQKCSETDEVRCIVLKGEGGFFCSGADLKAMGGAGGEKESPVPNDTGGFPKLNMLFAKLGKPTIAMVEGAAVAGGLGLMMACDFSIAADNATFATPEIKRGLWPMMIMRHIFACVPKKKAIDLIMTGRKIDAVEAEKIGVITRSVAPDKLVAEVDALAETLAGNSPIIMRYGIEAMNEQFKMEHEEAFPYLSDQLQKCMQTEDFREGIMAFAQKRKPVWKGK
jgi:enoyl-CoA hydratase